MQKIPTKDETFLQRICTALDMTPKKLASQLGVRAKELEPLLGKYNTLAGVEEDYVWWKLEEYVSVRAALLFTIKTELSAKLQTARKKKIMKMNQFYEVINDTDSNQS